MNFFYPLFSLVWRCLALLIVIVFQIALAAPAGSIVINNLGESLSLTAMSPPAALPLAGMGLRYFQTQAGEPIALANRVLVVISDRQYVAAISHLPAVRNSIVLANLAEGCILQLGTVDVPAALKLARQLRDAPGIRAAQVDISQNLSRHDGPPMRFDLANFDLATAIGLRDAWRVSRGAGINIAVIDAGIDLQHRDLRGLKLVATYDVESGTDDISPRDSSESHGTLVTGLIFARHNDFGIDGVAPDAGLIGIRLRSSWTSDIVLALDAARRNGANVINLSWTVPLMLEPIACLLDDLTEHGRSGKGVIVVVAAGNKRIELSRPTQFAAYPALWAVTALDHRGLPYGTAYGPAIFMAAPGMVKSTSNRLPDAIEHLGATSAAAPIVSGVAALLLAVQPQASRAAIREILIRSANLAGLDDIVNNRSQLLGAGRLDAAAALALAASSKSEVPRQ